MAVQALFFRNQHVDEPFICKAVLTRFSGKLFHFSYAIPGAYWPSTLQVILSSMCS